MFEAATRNLLGLRHVVKNKDAAFAATSKRHGEIFPNNRGTDPNIDASAHRLGEFPAGYSWTGCSPALPASASPAGTDYVSEQGQVRGSLHSERSKKEKRDEFSRQRVGLIPTNLKYESGQLVCYKKRPTSCARDTSLLYPVSPGL